MNDERALVNLEIGEVHREFRRHMPDDWAEFCPVCDCHGKCAEYHRLLERLHILEALDYDLAELEEPEGDHEAATTAVAGHRAKLAELAER